MLLDASIPSQRSPCEPVSFSPAYRAYSYSYTEVSG